MTRPPRIRELPLELTADGGREPLPQLRHRRLERLLDLILECLPRLRGNICPRLSVSGAFQGRLLVPGAHVGPPKKGSCPGARRLATAAHPRVEARPLAIITTAPKRPRRNRRGRVRAGMPPSPHTRPQNAMKWRRPARARRHERA